MTVPKGFTVRLAAAEPDVVRPIGFALDDRGRLCAWLKPRARSVLYLEGGRAAAAARCVLDRRRR